MSQHHLQLSPCRYKEQQQWTLAQFTVHCQMLHVCAGLVVMVDMTGVGSYWPASGDQNNSIMT